MITRLLPVSRRLVLIGVALSIPVLVLVVQSVGTLTKGTSTAVREMTGTAYLRPLIGLLDSLSSHRLAVIGEKQGLGAAMHVSQANQRVDKALEALRAVQAALGTSLQVTPEGLRGRHREHASVETIASEWAVLKRDLPDLSAEAAGERHAHLAADVRMLSRHVGDASSLILDPDLDSYYTMDLVLTVLPQTIDRLAAIGEVAWLHRGAPLSSNDRTTLAVLAHVLQENDRDRVLTNTETALSEDALFNGPSPTLFRIQAPAATYASAVDSVISHLRVAAGESDGRAELMRAGQAAIEARQAASVLWAASADELDRLLEARITAFRTAQWGPLGVALITWAGALGVAWLLNRPVPDMPVEEHRPVGTAADRANAVVTEPRVPRARQPWSPPPLASKPEPDAAALLPPAPDGAPTPFVERRGPGRPFTRPPQSKRA